jgi:serine phosphatase RsbU (regulator of sigma subunit)
LEGIDEDWSSLTTDNKADYRNIPHGTYTFKLKALGGSRLWSDTFEYSFVIHPPWWLSWWAYSAYSLLVFGMAFSYIRMRESSLKKRQRELEEKVSQATFEIRKQKDEVEKQKDFAEEQRKNAESQKHFADLQKHLAEEKNREILDSIEYAKRIQTAILPPLRIIREFLENAFVLYLPKDIVAGDFYWMETVGKTIYLAACDCTGHGVPGAMVSVVCNNALNRSLNEFGEREPGKIFDRTRELILENFSKSDEEVKDGMDASLCCLNLEKSELLWAGANNPLWIYRNGAKIIEEIKPDKQPIGSAHKPSAFTTHKIEIYPNDVLYLFTDGFTDQFGGSKNKKLTKRIFREILTQIAELPMEEQRSRLLDFHLQYRGKNEQVDDICIIGVKV